MRNEATPIPVYGEVKWGDFPASHLADYWKVSGRPQDRRRKNPNIFYLCWGTLYIHVLYTFITYIYIYIQIHIYIL
jgi:hypothetical protein